MPYPNRKAIAPVAAVMLAIGGAAAYFLLRPDNSSRADSEITAVIESHHRDGQNGDLQKFKATLCTPLSEFEFATMTDAQFKAVAKRSVEVDGRFVLDRVEDIKISGDRATAIEIGHNEGGRLAEIGEERRTVGLNKIEGTWKICNLPTDDPATTEKKKLVETKAEVHDAVENYFELQSEGDLVAMIRASCGELRELFAGMEPEAFADAMARTPERIKSIDEVTVTGDAAKVTATVDSEAVPEPVVAVVSLTNEAYQWKPCKVEIIAS
ncbi:hypothetical protein [Mycobacterium hubeiense]|uniref:Rv0361 family membrane protein n=1 Tax=Mycobacterium hubeiense TaxID=1867256 RepID=UPI000C7EDE5A|nr:hypothetical protein [Mycobacterium sp. QGD 101]